MKTRINNIFLVTGMLFCCTQIFGQYFSKVYPSESTIPSIIYQAQPIDGGILCNMEQSCSTNQKCTNSLTVDYNGEVILQAEIQNSRSFFFNMATRNDTIFKADVEFNPQDSAYYWKVLMTDFEGNILADYKYPVQQLSDAYTSSRKLLIPNLYGLLLLKDGQILLYGEGRETGSSDNLVSAMFFRIKLNGSIKSDVYWFKPVPTDRKMLQGVLDIDGNPVFHIEYIDKTKGDKFPYYKDIYKVFPNDSIALISSVNMSDYNRDVPGITVDNTGNYFINTRVNEGTFEGYGISTRLLVWLSKINRQGIEEWRKPVIPHVITNWNQAYTSDFIMHRITTTANGDILCTGRVYVFDHIYNKVRNEIQQMYGNCSFIARFDTNGNILWQHFIVPYKKDGAIRENIIYDIKEDIDGSIITAGELQKYNGTRNLWTSDAWLMRLNDKGCLTDDCDHVEKYWNFPAGTSSTNDQANILPLSLSVSPNPGNHHISIVTGEEMTFPLHYEITSISGYRPITGVITNLSANSIDVNSIPYGMYIIHIRDQRGRSGITKWIKQK